MNESTSISLLTILLNLLSFIAGFLSAVFAEPIRKWLYRPKLELEFVKESPNYKARTPERIGQSTHEAYYIRVKATNTKGKIAKGCRAYLVNIEKDNSTGIFDSTEYCDSIQLAWSCRDNQAYEGIDLPNGIAQFIDVIVTRDFTKAFELQTMVKPFRYKKLYQEQGIFRLTIQVSGEEIKPEFLKLIFHWTGQWDNFKVLKEY
jgi:hypothetical protein